MFWPSAVRYSTGSDGSGGTSMPCGATGMPLRIGTLRCAASGAAASPSATSAAVRLIRIIANPPSALHAPAPHGAGLDRLEDHVLDEQPEQDHGQKAREHVRDQELILALEDIPAEAAGARADPEH